MDDRIRVTACRAAKSAALFIICALSGCAGMRMPQATPTPSPTVQATLTPSPAPPPETAFPAGEPVMGMVSAVTGTEDGVYLFQFEAGDESVPVLAQASMFTDELGGREAVVSAGDTVEIVFDIPVYAGGYASGVARSVKVLLYGDYRDYSDPLFAALLWAYEYAPEWNEGAEALFVTLAEEASPTSAQGFSTAFASALQSFCLTHGYSLESAPSARNGTLAFTLTALESGEDSAEIAVQKSRQSMGEAGARLSLVKDGAWKVEGAHSEYYNVVE